MAKGPEYLNWEDRIVRKCYPTGGYRKCQTKGVNRSRYSIQAYAARQKIRYLGNIKWKGKYYRLRELARLFQLNPRTLWNRLYRYEWSMDRALTERPRCGR